MGGARILLLFWDGVGLDRAGPGNPWTVEEMPTLRRLLDGPLSSDSAPIDRPGLLWRPIDATLGVPGLPQSATGQTALLTGVNAARELGRHVAAFPGPQLRALLREHSLFRRLAAADRPATFANPFSAWYWDAVARGERKASATTLAVQAGGQRFRDLEDWRRGEAVPWDVVGDRLRAMMREAGDDGDGAGDWPERTAQAAGTDLARLASRHSFTLHETFLPDLAGHGRWGVEPGWALPRLDRFLGGVLAGRPDDLTVLLTSDHGNSEVAGDRRHTRNPVPLLVVGPAAAAFAGVGSLVEIAAAILRAVAVEPAGLP